MKKRLSQVSDSLVLIIENWGLSVGTRGTRQGELFQKFPLEPLKIFGAWRGLCRLLCGFGEFSL